MNPPAHASPNALLSLQPGDPAYGVLTELAAAEARQALGKDLEFEPETVDTSGHWAFVRGRLRDAGGASLSLEDTPFAGLASAGTVSDTAAVLFKKGPKLEADNAWIPVDRAIVPTDVAWLDWPRRHGAPGELLGIG
jgi:hypothetical protein